MARNVPLNVLGSVVVWSFCVFAGRATLGDGPPDEGFDTTLPVISGMDHLADGAWACATIGSVYVSTADPKRWELFDTGLPRGYGIHRCAGGTRNRMFLVVQPAGESSRDLVLYAVEPHKKPARMRPLRGADAVGFCSETTGAISTGANVGVTIDGGKSWHPTPPLFEAENAEISLLRWVDASRLLLSDGRVLALYELQAGATLRLVWRSEPPVGNRIETRSCDCDGNNVWLMGKDQFHRFKLDNGQRDLTVPRDGTETNFRDVDGGLVVWRWGASSVREIVRKPGGAYAVRGWLTLSAAPAGIVPLGSPHFLALTCQGDAYDLDLSAGRWTPAALRVTPRWSERIPVPSAGTTALVEGTMDLASRLPRAEVDAIGTRLLPKMKGMTTDQWFTEYRDELRRAVEKHRADGTLPPLRQMLVPQAPPPPRLADGVPTSTMGQILHLSRELPEAEVRQVWFDARLKAPGDPAKARLWVKAQLEKLAAKHKSDGTLRKPEADDAARDPEGAAPAVDQDALLVQILHLGLQLPEAEVKHVWDEARRKERDPTKQRLWVKDRFEKLIAKHKADGTLPKSKSGPPDQK